MIKKMAAIISVALAGTQLAYGATESGKEGGGGDVCQAKIQQIRDNIYDWIQSGFSAGLDFTNTTTYLAAYNAAMEKIILFTQRDNQASISCTPNMNDVVVEGAQKVCKAYFENNDPTRPRILCYRGTEVNGTFKNGFMGSSDEEQYFQIHHEFAVLAGFEDQTGQSSDYLLSQQISSKLVTKFIKELPVGATGGSSSTVINSDDCPNVGDLTFTQCRVMVVPGKMELFPASRYNFGFNYSGISGEDVASIVMVVGSANSRDEIVTLIPDGLARPVDAEDSTSGTVTASCSAGVLSVSYSDPALNAEDGRQYTLKGDILTITIPGNPQPDETCQLLK